MLRTALLETGSTSGDAGLDLVAMLPVQHSGVVLNSSGVVVLAEE